MANLPVCRQAQRCPRRRLRAICSGVARLHGSTLAVIVGKTIVSRREE